MSSLADIIRSLPDTVLVALAASFIALVFAACRHLSKSKGSKVVQPSSNNMWIDELLKRKASLIGQVVREVDPHTGIRESTLTDIRIVESGTRRYLLLECADWQVEALLSDWRRDYSSVGTCISTTYDDCKYTILPSSEKLQVAHA